MKQTNSPRCRGSKKASFTNDKRALCYWCGNLVAVHDGRFCEHWWSCTAKRFHSGLRKG